MSLLESLIRREFEQLSVPIDALLHCRDPLHGLELILLLSTYKTKKVRFIYLFKNVTTFFTFSLGFSRSYEDTLARIHGHTEYFLQTNALNAALKIFSLIHYVHTRLVLVFLSQEVPKKTHTQNMRMSFDGNKNGYCSNVSARRRFPSQLQAKIFSK